MVLRPRIRSSKQTFAPRKSGVVLRGYVPPQTSAERQKELKKTVAIDKKVEAAKATLLKCKADLGSLERAKERQQAAQATALANAKANGKANTNDGHNAPTTTTPYYYSHRGHFD